MIKKLMIIPLVLLFILAASPSLAQSLNNSTNESSGSIGIVQDVSASAFNESEQIVRP